MTMPTTWVIVTAALPSLHPIAASLARISAEIQRFSRKVPERLE